MHKMMLIDGDRVHKINSTLCEKNEKVFEHFEKMKWKLLGYLTYKNEYEESIKKDTELKTMMIDDLKHFKHAYANFFKVFKENADCEEEKSIITSLTEVTK